MKKTLLALMMLCCAIASKAQVTDEISAILQVGDSAKIFYGADALKDAMEAAPDRGATITLSSGTFNATQITKCVNIYGAGWETINMPKDSVHPFDNSIRPTIIVNTMEINLPAELTAPHNIHLEGLRFNGIFSPAIGSNPIDGLEVMKCYFAHNVGGNTTALVDMENKNVYFIQCCIITGMFCAFFDMKLQNCFVSTGGEYSIIHSRKEGSSLVFDHCIVGNSRSSSYTDHGPLICNNCIVSITKKNSSQIYRYCMMTDEELDASFIGSENNWFGLKWSTVFKDAIDNLNYSDDRTFEFNEPSAFIGNDGTLVGINGGSFPWNKTPHTPLVKNLKLTINGTNLNVNYDAEAR
ncbi:MAG: hypothetical protein IKR18_03705 [Bacteroidaceae bacterium]|nr:hypothetical protein [Bacteroidaceae bacterium]